MKLNALSSCRLSVFCTLLAALATLALPARAQVISEFVARNDSGHMDEDGELFDWLELHNPGATAVDLGGYYLTDKADNLVKWAIPAGVTLPPGGFLVVFASEKNRRDPAGTLHTNFKLSGGGEFLALVEPDGVTVVHGFGDAFPPQLVDVSYGLAGSSNVGSAGFFDPPTPGEANPGTFANFVGDVEFSHGSDVYFDPITLVLSGANAGETIRYTSRTIGSPRGAPTAASTAYTGPIQISETTQIRARVFGADGTPGESFSRTYIIGENASTRYLGTTFDQFTSHLPIMVLTNFRQTQLLSNRGTQTDMHWLLYEPNEATGGRSSVLNPPDFESRGRFNVRGSSTANNAKYSLSVEVWDEDDEDRDVEILGMPAESDWILSARYRFDRALVRNPLMYELSNQIGRYAVRTRFVEVFVDTNGGTTGDREYMGVYTFMEKIKRGGDRVDVEPLTPAQTEEPEVTGGYLFKNDRRDPQDGGMTRNQSGDWEVRVQRRFLPWNTLSYLDPKEVEIERVPEQQTYLKDALTDVGEALFAADGISPLSGKHFRELIDVPAWLDHHWLNVLAMNVDGFRLSGYLYKERNGPVVAGPIWDFDRTMESDDSRDDDPQIWDGPPDSSRTWYDNRYPAWGWLLGYTRELNFPRPPRAAIPISNYPSRRPDVFQEHTDRWFELREGAFSTANIHGIIDRMTGEIGDAQVRNFVRWREHAPRITSGSRSVREFERDPNNSRRGTYQGEVNQLKEWLRQRVEWIDDQYPEMPALGQDGGVVADGFELTARAGEGTVYVGIGGADPRASGGEPSGAAIEAGAANPVVLTQSGLVTARTKREWMWSAPQSAYFVVGEERASGDNLVVSELMYHPAQPSAAEIAAGFEDEDDFEFVELLNTGDAPVNLYEMEFVAGFDFAFSEGAIESLRPGERGLLVRELAAFEMRYGAGLPVIGEYRGDRLSNGGETVTLVGHDGSELVDFTFSDDLPWPEGGDGDGFSLVLQAPETGPNPNLPESWAAGGYAGGTPGFPESAYYDWKRTNGVVADFGDGDGDGTFALAEFLLGTGAGDPDDGFATHGPRADSTDVGGQIVPAVEVVVSDAAMAAGGFVEPEVSGGLGDWQSGIAAVQLVRTTPNGDGTTTRVYVIDGSIGSEAGYVRFRMGIR